MTSPFLRLVLVLATLVATRSFAQRRPWTGVPPGQRKVTGKMMDEIRQRNLEAQKAAAQRTPTSAQTGSAPAAASPIPPRAAPTPSRGADRQIAPRTGTASPAANAGASATNGASKPTCEEVRRKARYGIYFDKVDIEKLVQTVADATCRTFILPENVRGKISIVGPENGKVEVNADQFYAAFLAALESNGLSVYPYGKFLKIVDKREAKQNPIPLVIGDEGYPTTEQMITKMFRLKNVEPDQMRGVIQQLVSKGGDSMSFPPDTLIVNDTGANMHRIERVIDQLDTGSASDEMQVIQIQYASVNDVSQTLQKLFEAKNGRTGASPTTTPPRTFPNRPVPGAARTNTAPGAAGQTPASAATVTQMIPDERTNKLIVVASPSALERIHDLLNQIDVPISGEGRINVYNLANANAEELASTLQGLAQSAGAGGSSSGGNRPRVPVPAAANVRGAANAGAQTAELFSGEVKITADKATNALVIVANQGDYRNIVRVIEKLDVPRKQVFVEAVIMEVTLQRNSDFGVSWHQGYSLNTPEGQSGGIVGTNYAGSGLPPSFSLLNLASYGGFLAGLQGPAVSNPALTKLGINIPSFGVVLHALQENSDVNVLSTPHLLTSDNEEAEITVGQTVPFQSGFAPSSLGSTLGSTTGTSATGALGALGGLGSLGGLSSLYAPINRQPVELKLTIKPQINDSDYVRMVINESTEEIASQNAVLGPTTSKRSAKTTVVAKDQETVVIGGIMQDRTINSVSKVPILGDLPILGHLFRETSVKKVKTNLLLFLTPYIIRDQSDFRRIFERKMAERQKFVEQFYGGVSTYDVPVDYERKAGPFAKINAAVLREEQKAENGGPGLPGEKVIKPDQKAPASPGQVTPLHAPEPSAPAPSNVDGAQQPGQEAPEAPDEGDHGREAAPPPEGSQEPPPAQEDQPLRPQPPSDDAP